MSNFRFLPSLLFALAWMNPLSASAQNFPTSEPKACHGATLGRGGTAPAAFLRSDGALMSTPSAGGIYAPVLQQAGGPVFHGSVSVSGAMNVGAPDRQICAVSAAAEVWCLGNNQFGQNGNGVVSAAPTVYPVKVLTAPDAPLTDVASVTTSLTGSCALRNDGTVWCWGNQDATVPALGDGTNAARAFAGPVLTAPATPLTGITKVSTVTNGSAAAAYCALNDASNVVCWGQQVNNAFSGNGSAPVPYATASVLNNAGGPAFGPVSTFDYGWFAGYFVKAGNVYRLGQRFALGVSGGGGFPYPTLMTFANGDPFADVVDVTLGHGGTFNTGRGLARKADGSAWEIMNPVDGDILRFVKTGSNAPIVATQIGDGTALEADGSIWFAGGTVGTALRCTCMADAECGTAFPGNGGNLPACIEDPASAKFGSCVRCDANNTSACVGSTPQCDPASNTCFGCTGDLGGAGAHPCNDPNAPFCRVGACLPCNGDFGSGGSAACGAATPACLPSGSCGQCSASNSSACVGGTPICDTATNTCTACNGDFGSGNSAACGSAALPACLPNGTCGECSATNSSACVGAKPVCDTAANACAPCNGDLGSGATLECPLAASPTCSTTVGSIGTCGKCLTNLDCAGHPNGPLCNVLSGACGTACTQDSDCDANEWCDNPTGVAGTGTCTAKTPNGQLLPASPPINAVCTTPNGTGARVCESTQCEPSDNLCGLTNGSDCLAAGNDTFCRSTVCFDADSKCGLPNKEACTSDTLCRSAECFPADSLCGLPNGETCAAATVCRSNECFPADSKCGLPNSEACTTAEACRSTVCFATDSLCGLPNGEACNAPGVCRSGVCADGVCGACASNADCSSPTPICNTTTHVCEAAAEPDAGAPDGGAPDAGRPDAGRPDASTGNGSSGNGSSGNSSSGNPSDPSAEDPGYFDLSGGSCAAFVSGSNPIAPLGVLAGLGLLLSRRRRRH